jgi:hypothetical protein
MTNSNSNANGNSGWRNTKILETQGARETDALRQMLRDQEWWKSFDHSRGSDRKQIAKKLHYALDKLVAEPRRSTAMDGLDDFDEPSRQYLSGLRYYFSNLKPNEPLNVAMVRALLQNIMETL